MTGLYVHVPFCIRKCSYCDFYSLPEAADDAEVSLFLEGLRQELAMLPAGFRAKTIYVGGGTPTALKYAAFRRLLDQLRRAVPAAISEWTVEANPATLEPNVIRLLKEFGVNRISLGIQSLNDAVLKRLGRVHSADDGRTAYGLLRDAGFDNISVDLMFAVPGQTKSDVKKDVQDMIALGADHISCYALSIEPGTPFDRMRRDGRIIEVAPDVQREQYDGIRNLLSAAGYVHYEISNFAKPDRACRHNVNYWMGGAYVGCGPSAHSHWQGARWGNVRDLHEWARRLARGEPPREFEEHLPPEAKARETLILNLRLLKGVMREAFREQTGFDYRDLAGEAIARFVSEGWLLEENGRLRLAEKALFVSNAVFAELV